MIRAEEETMFRAETESVQLTRLEDMVKRAYERVSAHRARMEVVGIQPDDIWTLKDLQKLPSTVKQNMRDNYPYGLFTVPRKEPLRIHVSGGTMGKPTVVRCTQNDLDVWRECMVHVTVADGATGEDVTQICFGYGMPTGTLNLHNNPEEMGTAIVPSSTGNTQKQLMHMKDFETTLLMATPSHAMRTAGVALEMGLDPKKDLKAESLVLGNELMTETMRNEFYKVWEEGVSPTRNYSMSELMGPSVSGECFELNGIYTSEDHFIAEVTDPKTGQVLPAGEKGELVITYTIKEVLLLTRYHIRGIAKLMYEPCPYDCTTTRMENLSDRTGDMPKIHGANVFPNQIEEVPTDVDGIGSNYKTLVDRKNHSNLLTIRVEAEAEGMVDSCAALKKLDQSLREKMRMMFGLDVKVQLVSPNILQWFEGKAKRMIDLRVRKSEA